MPEKPPNGWLETVLGAIAEPSRGRASPRDVPDLPYIGLEHIEPQTMKLLGHKYAREVRSPSLRFSTSDVLYGKMRPYLNKVWVAKFDGLCSAEFLVFPKCHALNSQFLAFRLNADDFVAFANGQVSGERPRVDFDRLSHFPLLLPPIAEQRRIVTRLNALTSRMERAETAARRARERLQRYRAAVLRHASTGELTRAWRASQPTTLGPASESGAVLLQSLLATRRALWEESELSRFRIAGKEPKDARWKARYREPAPPDISSGLPHLPRTWAWASLDQLSWTSGYGTSTKCTYEGKGPAVLRIPNIRSRALDFVDLKFAVSTQPVGDRNFIAPGDFLLVRTNGSKDLIGRAAVAITRPDKRCSFASYLIRFRLVGSAALWSWLVYAWDSPLSRVQIENKAVTTAGQYNLSLSKIASIAVPLPPLAEQSEIVHAVTLRLSAADRLAAVLEQQLLRSRVARQSLLQDAFAGRLVPQNTNDRGASFLLDRIHAERMARAQTPKAKPMPKSKIKAHAALRPLLEVLEANKKPVTPEQLFIDSGYRQDFELNDCRQEIVERFYEELRHLVGPQGLVEEIRPNNATVLLRVK
jgi:type I restriction enzyme S subunit